MASPPERLYWARIMTGGMTTLGLFGNYYDQGELLTLPEDVTETAGIVRMEFVMRAPEDKTHLRAECGVCQKWFLNEHFRDQHGRLRHRQRFVSEDLDVAAGMTGPDGGAALRDITGDAEDRRRWQDFPPNLEKTKASQQG